MSSSSEQIISPIIKEIQSLHPKTVLDIGIGYGKWGFLCREYLESWYNRIYPNEWKIRIDGIEIWKPYIDDLPWNKIIYDKLYLGDAYEVIDKTPNYDLIIASEVIEHMSKERGLELMKKCIGKSQCFILSIPLGKGWLNNVAFDNPYNKHQASWELDEIKQLSKDIKIIMWKGVRGDGCIAIFKK